jgi:Fic family protein
MLDMPKINTPDNPNAAVTTDTQAHVSVLRESFQARIHNAIDPRMEIHTILTRAFPECLTIEEALTQIDEIKKCFDSFKPFSDSQMSNLQEAWDTEYTYESNRIEGNTLTLRETSLVINDGITVGGKSMKEHLEAVNHKAAVILMRQLADAKQKIDAKTLLKIHSLILRTIDDRNAGFFRDVRVGIRGTQKVFPNPVKVPYLIDEFFKEFEEDIQTMHPVLAAAKIHHRVVNIHPFSDGNGRTSRLMQNLHLLQNGFVVANLKGADSNKIDYYDALDAADAGNYDPFYKLIISEEKQSLLRYIEMMCCNIGDDEKPKGNYFFQLVGNI